MATVEDSLLSELTDIRATLARHAPQPADRYALVQRTLSRIERSFMTPLRMAVLGEGKSGKSLLINYLLKHQILPSGGFAGENTEILIRYAPEASVHSVGADGSRNRLTSKAFGRLVKPEGRPVAATPAVIYDASAARSPASTVPNIFFSGKHKPEAPERLIEVGLPLEFLKRVEIVEVRDYPDPRMRGPSHRAFRRVGVSIWCTLATQAWKETEVHAWSRIPGIHRRGALILVTYKDAIRNPKDETKIIARLRHATTKLFDDVVLVSLRDAVQSLVSERSDEVGRLRSGSNVESAETAIIALIERWQLKRLQKASRILRLVAAKLSLAGAEGTRLSSSRELAIRLERLAMEFFHASPSISLGSQAA